MPATSASPHLHLVPPRPPAQAEPDVRQLGARAHAGDGVSEPLVQLVQLAQDGSAEAFGELYRIYQNTVFSYVYYRVPSHALAEDLTSETFVRALRRITTFRWQGRDFGAWLVTIARNMINDHYKCSRTKKEFNGGELGVGILDGTQSGGWLYGDAHPSPEEELLQYLSGRDALMAVLRLGEEQREVVILRLLQDKSVAEAARVMGKSEGAIKALQCRATQNLRRALHKAA